MDPGEIINKNCERLIALRRIHKRTKVEEGEYARRESLQYRYNNFRTDAEREKIIKEIKESFE